MYIIYRYWDKFNEVDNVVLFNINPKSILLILDITFFIGISISVYLSNLEKLNYLDNYIKIRYLFIFILFYWCY